MRQGNREKLSVTIEPGLFRAVARHARKAGVPRSRVVEDAIRFWELGRLAALAREGYQEMATEDVTDAEAYLAALADLGEE